MGNETHNKRPIIIAGVIFLVLLAVVGMLLFNKPVSTAAGEKTITVEVHWAERVHNTYPIVTDAEFLRGALEQQNLIAGDESEMGLYVKTVDGITADDTKQEWWCFTKGGEELFTGVDETPIQDGDRFEITLKVGW